MRKSIIVLGAGMVGAAMANDLSKRFNVTLVDINDKALDNVRSQNTEIHTKAADLSNTDTIRKISNVIKNNEIYNLIT